jgi:DNA repair exonuclease SbcCD ATPase subunit
MHGSGEKKKKALNEAHKANIFAVIVSNRGGNVNMKHAVTGQPVPVRCRKFDCIKHKCKLKYVYYGCEFYAKGEVKVIQIRILQLSIRNFKGIKELQIKFGNKTDIYGDNATGKTTIFDAFTWLLFDKDSSNQKDFNIKPLDPDGEAMHGIETEVEAMLDVNGHELKLKKIFQEKWTKQRGSAEKVFSGHTTDYFLADVPVKKSEYDEKIKSLADEKIFKLLTNPLYFNEQLHWQDRRKILLEMCEDVSDDDVIRTNPKLSALSLQRSIDDMRKILMAKRKEINEQLEKIPVRIDEVAKSMPDISGIDFEQLKSKIGALQMEQEEKRAVISRLQNGGEIAEKQKQLAELETELLKLKNKHEERKRAALDGLREEADELSIKCKNAHLTLGLKQNEIDSLKRSIERIEKAIQILREQWAKVNAQILIFEDESVCPMCGQPIPEWQIDEKREKATKEFNLKKSQQLETINKEGKAMKAELEAEKQKFSRLTAEFETLKAEYETVKTRLDAVNAKIEEAKLNFPDVTAYPDYKEILQRKQAIEVEITSLRSGSLEEAARTRAEIADIESEIITLQAELAKKDQAEKAQARIEELKAEEKRLAREYEKVESELFLTEEFIRTKVQLLTEKINSKFKLARFKLFEQQINGGLQEVCETMFNGVPYTDLNNAMKINIGLDIINTLSKHYNFEAPIFIDNRESVTKLIETKTQIVSLIVSEPDKKIRVVA